MAEVASAFVTLMPSTRGFGSTMNRQLTPQINSTAKTAGSRFGKVFAYSSMSPLKAIGAAAFGLFAIKKVKDFFSGAIDEARESQKVSALTAQVIKSTGGAAGISAKQVGNLAGQISLMTGIDDEAIQGAENLLLTFTNLRNGVGKGNDVFNQATKIVTDMSTALDQDLKSSSIQVGKALNDPVKGITALSRVGVSFTEQQKKQIETLVKSGDTMGAQKIILGELNKEFGGAAAAAATSGDKFKTAFANLQEQIGLALLPYLDKLLDKGTVVIGFLMTQVPAGISAFKNAITPLTDVLGDLINNHLEVFHTVLAALAGGAIASVIGLIGGGLVAVLATLASVLASPIVLIGLLAGAAVYAYMKFESFRALVQQVIAWFQSSFVPAFMAAVAAVQGFAAQFWARIQPLLPQVQQIFGQIVSTVKTYLGLLAAEVKAAIAVVQFIWRHFNGQMLDYAVSSFKNILLAIKGALNIIQGVFRLVTSLIKGDWSGAWAAIKQIVKGAWQLILAIVKQSFAQLKALFGVIKTTLPIIASKAWDLVKAAFKAGIQKSIELTKDMPGLAVKAIKAGVPIMLGAGKDLIRGFINGIKAMATDVLNAVGDVVKGGINKAKSLLHIGSPSKLFHQFGFWTMEGFANGIGDAGPKALKALQDSLGKLTDWATSWRDKIKSTLDGVKQDFASLRDSVASSFSGGLFDVSAISAAVSDTTITAAQSVGQVFTNNLADTKGRLTELLKAFRKLKGWGLSSQFLSQLFASGNSALILELAGGTKKGASSAAGLFGDVQTLSNQLGTAVAGNQFNPQLKRLEDRLDKANGHLKYLDGLAHDITKALNAAAAAAHRRHAAA